MNWVWMSWAVCFFAKLFSSNDVFQEIIGLILDPHSYVAIIILLLVNKLGKETDFESIDRKFIHEFSENFSYHEIEDLKNDPHFRILRIRECQNIKALLDKLQGEAFQSAFSKTSHLFVFIIETTGETLHDLTVPILIDHRPLIIQIMEGPLKSIIFYKESNSEGFVKVDGSTKIKKEAQALKSLLFGTLNCNLMDMKLERQDLVEKASRSAIELDVLGLRLLQLFTTKLDVDISSLLETLRYGARESLLILLELPFTIEDVDHDFEILMAIVRSNNNDLLRKVLHNGFELGCKAAHVKTALELEFFDCAVELVEADSSFPFDFDIKNIPLEETAASRLKVILDERTSFHDAINAGNMDLVKGFIGSHPRLKYAYDTINKAAVTVAVEAKEFAVYLLLLSRGFSSGIDDKFEDLMNKLTDKDKIVIREMNKRYFKASEISYLFHLLARTKLSLSPVNNEDLFEIIRKMYEKLNEIEEVRPILKLLENCNIFQIIFDKTKPHVREMDPTASDSTRGIVYPSRGYIYIAAANHDNDEIFKSIIGTLAHELMHYAMKLAYDNNCKPYNSTDKTRKNEFDKICQNIYQYSKDYPDKTSSIISSVFEFYDKPSWHAELIVRIPQLSALYSNDEFTLMKKEYCGELYDFHKNSILNDITNIIDYIKPQAEIKEINKIIGLIAKVKDFSYRMNETFEPHQFLATIEDENKYGIISSNVSMLTLSQIYQLLFKKHGKHLDKRVIFADMESLNNSYLSEKIQNLFKSKVNPLLIVKADQIDNHAKEMIEDMQPFDSNQSFSIVTNSGDHDSEAEQTAEEIEFEYYKLSYKWEDLDDATRDKLLQKKVNFNGRSVELNEIMPSDSIIDFPLASIMSDQLVIENAEQENNFSFLEGTYIDRKFAVERNEETNAEPSKPKGFREGLKRLARSKSEEVRDSITVSVQMNHEELLQAAAAQKIVVISDVSGMGKSTTLREMSKILMKKLPTHWVNLVDLKQHIKEFDQVVQSKTLTMSDILLKCIDKDFYRKIFLALYKEGRVIVLLDGFDEISQHFKGLIVDAIKTFNIKSGNQIWITTRSHLQKDLDLGINLPRIYCSLVPLTKNDQVKIVTDHWKTRNIATNNSSRHEDLATSLIEKMPKDLSKSGSNLIEVPLLIRMIAEIYDQEFHELQTLNIYSIYGTFTDKIINNGISNKKKMSIKDQNETYKKLFHVLNIHRHMALYHLFGPDSSDHPFEKEPVIDDMVEKIGIVHSESVEKLQFVHETFAEFFVADFIMNNLLIGSLYANVQKTIAELLYKVLTDQKHQMIRVFLDNAFEIQNRQGLTKMTFTDHLEAKVVATKGYNILHKCANEQLESLFKVIADCVESFEDEKIKNEILKSKTDDKGNILMLACSNQDRSILKIVWENVRSEFTQKELRAMINEKEQNGLNALNMIIFHDNIKALEEFIMILTELYTDAEIKSFLNEKDNERGRSILCTMAVHSSKAFFDTFWKFLQRIFDQSKLKALLIATDTDQCNVLQLASRYNGKAFVIALFDIIKKLLKPDEQKAFIQHRNKLNENILHNAANNVGHEEVFTTLWDCLKDCSMEDCYKPMMEQKNAAGKNVLQINAERRVHSFRAQKVLK